MNLNKNSKLKEKVDSRKKISLLYDNNIIQRFNLYLRKKKNISLANKMFGSGQISEYDYHSYLKKISKENFLNKKKVEFLEEILFETEDCTLSSVFENGTIRYCINQYGMKDYYDSLEKAVENFVRISL